MLFGLRLTRLQGVGSTLKVWVAGLRLRMLGLGLRAEGLGFGSRGYTRSRRGSNLKLHLPMTGKSTREAQCL